MKRTLLVFAVVSLVLSTGCMVFCPWTNGAFACGMPVGMQCYIAEQPVENNSKVDPENKTPVEKQNEDNGSTKQ